jgi:hypothetical protein
MSAPKQPGGGQGQQGGPGSGAQSNPNQVTTTSSTQQATATAASHLTPTSIPSSSSKSHKGAIIGGIVGGVAGLLIISLVGVWLLQRRKQRQNGARARKTRPATYTGLNSVFRGVPFSHRPTSQSPHNSLLPQVQSAQDTTAYISGPNLRGGLGSSALRDSGNEMDNLPPTYAESQLSISNGIPRSHEHNNTSHKFGNNRLTAELQSSRRRSHHITADYRSNIYVFTAPLGPYRNSPDITTDNWRDNDSPTTNEP